MSELEQAIADAQAKHRERLTGPQTCCVKIGPDNMPCGKPVEFLSQPQGVLPSGWYHSGVFILDHSAVPASYAR